MNEDPIKMLRADLRFRLPDDFKGSLLDALRELIAFLESPDTGADVEPVTTQYGRSHPAWEHNRKLGLRAACTTGLFELQKTGWKKIDQKLPPRCHLDPVPDTALNWVK